MKMVEHRFNPDDKVYWIRLDNEPVDSKCPFCLGDGYFIRRLDNAKIICVSCKGSGKMNTGYDTRYRVSTGIVNAVNIRIQKNDTDILYNVCNIKDGWGCDLKDSELYENFGDALEKCDKLNNNGSMGSRGSYGTISAPDNLGGYGISES